MKDHLLRNSRAPSIVLFIASVLLSGCDGPDDGNLPAGQRATPVASLASDGLRNPDLEYIACSPTGNELVISRQEYLNKLQGFWLGQNNAIWSGLVQSSTEGLPDLDSGSNRRGRHPALSNSKVSSGA